MMMYKQQQQQQVQAQQQQQQHMSTPQQAMSAPQQYQNDELTRLLDSLHSKLETLQLQFPVNSYLRPTLDKLLKTITSAKFNSADSIRLIVFSVEGRSPTRTQRDNI